MHVYCEVELEASALIINELIERDDGVRSHVHARVDLSVQRAGARFTRCDGQTGAAGAREGMQMSLHVCAGSTLNTPTS